jgi:endonuclease VIII
MPEGDTIFRTARNIGRALIGKPVIGFRSTFPFLTRFNDDTPLVGQTVDQVEARGKWLLIHFSGGGILTSHLLMNGRWHIYRRGERWQAPRFHMRIVIENSEYQAVGFRVPVARMHTEQSLARDLHIARPENDLLSEEFDSSAALTRLLGRRQDALADALLDQSAIRVFSRVSAMSSNRRSASSRDCIRSAPWERLRARRLRRRLLARRSC